MYQISAYADHDHYGIANTLIECLVNTDSSLAQTDLKELPEDLSASPGGKGGAKSLQIAFLSVSK